MFLPLECENHKGKEFCLFYALRLSLAPWNAPDNRSQKCSSRCWINTGRNEEHSPRNAGETVTTAQEFVREPQALGARQWVSGKETSGNSCKWKGTFLRDFLTRKKCDIRWQFKIQDTQNSFLFLFCGPAPTWWRGSDIGWEKAGPGRKSRDEMKRPV